MMQKHICESFLILKNLLNTNRYIIKNARISVQDFDVCRILLVRKKVVPIKKITFWNLRKEISFQTLSILDKVHHKSLLYSSELSWIIWNTCKINEKYVFLYSVNKNEALENCSMRKIYFYQYESIKKK